MRFKCNTLECQAGNDRYIKHKIKNRNTDNILVELLANFENLCNKIFI